MDPVIDLSHYQTSVDFARVKSAGVIGVIHKATQGATSVDERFAVRRQQARDAGLLFGAYHFGTHVDYVAQANHFLEVADDGETLLVLDFERYTPSQMTLDDAEDFCDRVQGATGYAPVLYTGNSFINDRITRPGQHGLHDCPLWIARYSQRPPTVPPGWATWTLWQYSDKGQVDGVDGPVDVNRFNGDEAGLRRLWRSK